MVAAVVALGAAALIYREPLALGVAFLAAERRPSLLSDARWKDPASAEKFSSRFADGTRESELLEWLGSNGFTISEDAERARKLVQGFPCNEGIEVNWSRQPDGTIASAQAEVFEAGCL